MNRRIVRRAAAALLLCLWMTAGCTRLEPPSGGADRTLPNLELYSAEVKMLREGRPRFKIEAGTISRYEDRALLLLDDGVRVDFYDGRGRHNAVLTAERGEVLERTNRLFARGRVRVESDSGMVLLAQELHYDQALERVLSDSFVTIITPNDSLSGVGFSATPDLNDWLIRSPSGTTWRELERGEGR